MRIVRRSQRRLADSVGEQLKFEILRGTLEPYSDEVVKWRPTLLGEKLSLLALSVPNSRPEDSARIDCKYVKNQSYVKFVPCSLSILE